MKTIRNIALCIILSMAPAKMIGYPLYSTYPVFIPVPIPTYNTYQTPIIYPAYTPFYCAPVFMNLNNSDIGQASLRALLASIILTLSAFALDSISR